MGKSTESPASFLQNKEKTVKSQKPAFRPAVDDTKPVLQDPVRNKDLFLSAPYILFSVVLMTDAI